MDHIVASQTNSGHLEHSQAISATFKQFLDLGFWILDFGFLDFGFWILGFGFWIRAFLAIWKPPRPFLVISVYLLPDQNLDHVP